MYFTVEKLYCIAKSGFFARYFRPHFAVHHHSSTCDDSQGIDFPCFFYESVTDGRTDGPTNGRTDRPSYRDARMHLKNGKRICHEVKTEFAHGRKLLQKKYNTAWNVNLTKVKYLGLAHAGIRSQRSCSTPRVGAATLKIEVFLFIFRCVLASL